jgi:hypothetical protein
MHGRDEWVDVESVVTATKVLALFILDWCGIDPMGPTASQEWWRKAGAPAL